MKVDPVLVREVSRSFSLSLRMLPGPMREPVSLAYLLARATDTLADTEGVPVDQRLTCLDGFVGELRDGSRAWRRELESFSARQQHAGERELLMRIDDCLGWLDELPGPVREQVREVVTTIAEGQRLDLQRFGTAGGVLPDAEALEDYCYRVAGCVGRFWTQVGFTTLGDRFSRGPQAEMEQWGIAYGKGLQLVNILRDLPRDLAAGRCYLPVNDPKDRQQILAEADRWQGRARDWLQAGERYSDQLRGRRLRAATRLPAVLGVRTLDLLEGAKWERREEGLKVSRGTVWRSLFRCLLS